MYDADLQKIVTQEYKTFQKRVESYKAEDFISLAKILKERMFDMGRRTSTQQFSPDQLIESYLNYTHNNIEQLSKK